MTMPELVLLEVEKWSIFKECLDIVFKNWTALQLVTEDAPEKYMELLELTFDYFQQENLQIELEHLDYNFYEWFIDEFDCEIEDNSSIQISQDLISIHKEIFVDMSLVSYQKLKSSTNSSQVAIDASNDDHQMDTDEQQINRPIKAEPIIDEDGFELVVSKKKKNKNNN